VDLLFPPLGGSCGPQLSDGEKARDSVARIAEFLGPAHLAVHNEQHIDNLGPYPLSARDRRADAPAGADNVIDNRDLLSRLQHGPLHPPASPMALLGITNEESRQGKSSLVGSHGDRPQDRNR